MGWWKIDSVERGQIDPILGVLRGHGLANAIPGEDAAENYYNGDKPADICSDWLDETIDALNRVDVKPTRLLLECLWLKIAAVELPPRHCSALYPGVTQARNKIDHLYRTTWNRPPFDEEMLAIFNFVVNPHFRGAG